MQNLKFKKPKQTKSTVQSIESSESSSENESSSLMSSDEDVLQSDDSYYDEVENLNSICLDKRELHN